MDSIGIDENKCPVIFEYKRSINENVINQGLFYLDWLLDHKDSFKVLVIEKLGIDYADEIDWSMPRVMCIAADFTKYDEYAINQMTRNISLIRYRKFGPDLLMFEQINQNIVSSIHEEKEISKHTNSAKSIKEFKDQVNTADAKIQMLYKDLQNYILSLGDDVSEFKTKLYVAFKKIKNITCVVVRNNHIALFLPLDPSTFNFEEGFSRDVSNIGHWGTGNIEITIKNNADLEKVKPLIERAYNEN